MAHHNNKNKGLPAGRQGFILLLGILIATVLFSIGVSFSSIVYKELILSFTARESQISFYAADVGVECIEYWDNLPKDTRFGPGTTPPYRKMAPFENDADRNASDRGKIECGGTVMTLVPEITGGFSFDLDNDNFCDNSTIKKAVVSGSKQTQLRSWGFNTSPCDPNYPRRTDRALEAHYPTL